MSKQPNALRLAGALANCAPVDFDAVFVPAAAELRRQHALIAELVEALMLAEAAMNYLGDVLNEMDAFKPEEKEATRPAFKTVRASISKAKEAQQ